MRWRCWQIWCLVRAHFTVSRGTSPWGTLYKGTNPIHEGSTRTTLSPPKSLVLGLGFQCVNWGGRNTNIQSITLTESVPHAGHWEDGSKQERQVPAPSNLLPVWEMDRENINEEQEAIEWAQAGWSDNTFLVRMKGGSQAGIWERQHLGIRNGKCKGPEVCPCFVFLCLKRARKCIGKGSCYGVFKSETHGSNWD